MSALEPAVQTLIDKGVRIVNPCSVEIAADVDLNQISADGVVIYGGCRVRGVSTVISAGVQLGAEGPVTIEDCQLGPKVKLKGGYASKSVFLAGASMGLGHHVREGSILEEEASGAHTVGLKQTILFPFVTLGSLINFCDAFMAGGTSRSDHSEIGSSYIHFNFTPAGDKTTPSRFGDVPRGVMLRERPIFLGGQGGAVGPVQVAYGSVVGAGSVIREDILDENMLQVVSPPTDLLRPVHHEVYKKLLPMVAKNITYLANLDALQAWYTFARAPFFARQEFGPLILQGALDAIERARAERLTRLAKLAAKLDPSSKSHGSFIDALPELNDLFGVAPEPPPADLVLALTNSPASYLDAVRALNDDDADALTEWLQQIVSRRQAQAHEILPALKF